jgi:hypothetical protein
MLKLAVLVALVLYVQYKTAHAIPVVQVVLQ